MPKLIFNLLKHKKKGAKTKKPRAEVVALDFLTHSVNCIDYLRVFVCNRLTFDLIKKLITYTIMDMAWER